MKNILMLTMFCLSPMAFAEADFCTEQKGVLEFSEMGTYKFKTIEHCQMVYKKIKKCQDENASLYERGAPRMDCSTLFRAYLDSGTTNVEKVND